MTDADRKLVASIREWPLQTLRGYRWGSLLAAPGRRASWRAPIRMLVAAMKRADFDLGQRVSIRASKGRIVIEPAERLELKVEDLVAGITRRNLHDEADFGGPVGKEAL